MELDDKRFFQKIKTAITANPFSEERQQIDLEFTRLSRKSSPAEIIDHLIHRVEKSLMKYHLLP